MKLFLQIRHNENRQNLYVVDIIYQNTTISYMRHYLFTFYINSPLSLSLSYD